MCAEGYIGPLCEECDTQGDVWQEPYCHVDQFTCLKCSEAGPKIYFQLLVKFLVFMAMSIITSNQIIMFVLGFQIRSKLLFQDTSAN